MISTLLVDPKCDFADTLETHLTSYCPQIEILGKAHSVEEAFQLIQNQEPELLFIELAVAIRSREIIFGDWEMDFETIFLTPSLGLNKEGELFKKAGYLSLPISTCDLVLAIQQVQTQIKIKHSSSENHQILQELLRFTPPYDVISIPTIEGIEFLKVNEIIRCEGLQKYSRIVTTEKTDIISSYSIGHFSKMLEGDGFFSSHKSHLINLRHIKKFMPEGTVIMCDGSAVPVSRRRKPAFLDRINHFKLNRLC